MAGTKLIAPKAGEPIRESYLRELTARVERLEALSSRGERGFIDNTTGYFPFTKKLPVRQFELEEDLYRTTSADAKLLSWSQSEEDWIEGTGGTKTVYGDFATGYWFEGDKVAAAVMGGKYYAIGCGHVFIRGELGADLTVEGTAGIIVTEQNGTGNWVNTEKTINVHESFELTSTVIQESIIGAIWHEQAQIWIPIVGPC